LTADGSQFSLSISGATEGTLSLEFTSDYVSWQQLGDYAFTPPSMLVTDTVGPNVQARFYRARMDTNYFGTHVGFIRQAIPAGYSMIGNQLDAGDNSLGAIFPGAADSTTVYKFDESAQQFLPNTMCGGAWMSPAMTLNPGEGVIVWSPSAQTVEFVGQVRDAFHVRVEKQWCIRCLPVPQAGMLTSALQFPVGNSGDVIQVMTDTAAHYAVYTSDGTGWLPSEPSVRLGEAFWSWKGLSYSIWQGVFWSSP
jgi:hypothetical protein